MKKEAVKKDSAKKVEKKVSKAINVRVSTGIPNFDSLIEGGFEKNSTNLLVGDSGAGKSIFATQFLMEGVRKGEKCLYITFEEKKDQFYLNMKEFGWDLEEYEKKGLFIFLEYSPIKVKTMLEEGGGEVESLILKNKVTRIVIDSITSFELLFEDELAKREAALELFGLIRNWECTALLTLEEDASPSSDVASRALKFESDSMIVLYFPRVGKTRKRFVEVLKMRGTKHSKEVYPFEITSKGISIDKTPASDFLANGR
jgi:circadian clock protein KaiC